MKTEIRIPYVDGYKNDRGTIIYTDKNRFQLLTTDDRLLDTTGEFAYEKIKLGDNLGEFFSRLGNFPMETD